MWRNILQCFFYTSQNSWNKFMFLRVYIYICNLQFWIRWTTGWQRETLSGMVNLPWLLLGCAKTFKDRLMRQVPTRNPIWFAILEMPTVRNQKKPCRVSSVYMKSKTTCENIDACNSLSVVSYDFTCQFAPGSELEISACACSGLHAYMADFLKEWKCSSLDKTHNVFTYHVYLWSSAFWLVPA